MIAWPVVFTVIAPDCGHNYNPSRGELGQENYEQAEAITTDSKV